MRSIALGLFVGVLGQIISQDSKFLLELSTTLPLSIFVVSCVGWVANQIRLSTGFDCCLALAVRLVSVRLYSYTCAQIHSLEESRVVLREEKRN